MNSILNTVISTTQSRTATVDATCKERIERRGMKKTGEKTDEDIIIVFNYRLIESQNGRGWKRPLDIVYCKPSCQSRVI